MYISKNEESKNQKLKESDDYWRNYNDYKHILWMWMLNEVCLVGAVAEISHSGFYVQGSIHFLVVIFIGIPLVYSEICIAQYSNCDVITMWDYFPIFRGIGYGTIYWVFLKTILIFILNTWYVLYMVHSALDPPPWFTCDEFYEMNITKCMVKRVNISIFQHCIETQNLYSKDCGMKTASNLFFEREIGNRTTMIFPECVPRLKLMLIVIAVAFILFLLTLKHRFLPVGVKIVSIYLGVVIFVLFCVALSTSGTWYASKNSIPHVTYNLHMCLITVIGGFLSVGTGTGMITHLSRRTPFRSPATMTSITTPLLSIFITLMLSLIAFSGIKTMSYYHGEEENVIELGDNYFFPPFGSITEIISYFDALAIWVFAWFSAIFSCLLVQLWLLYSYAREMIFKNIPWARTYKKCSNMLLICCLVGVSCLFFCSDLTLVLIDVCDFIQIFSSLMFSISLYWIYGFYNHSVDIIFMIGVKASYFWKLTWLLNPIALLCILYAKLITMGIFEFENSYYIESINMEMDLFLFFVLIGVYVLIALLGLTYEICYHYYKGYLKNLFKPFEDWGPRDSVLLKSRRMFVPQIMTREFLYRQVKIYGYYRKKQLSEAAPDKTAIDYESNDIFETTEWSALTSN